MAALKLVELIATQDSLTEQRREFAQYPLERDSITVEDKTSVFEHVTTRVPEAYNDVQTLDGVHVSTDEGWFLIRPSGTQPLIQVMAEARTTTAREILFEEATQFVTDAHS